MFTVFGVNPTVEVQKLRQKLPDASETALLAGVRLCKAKPVHEYDNPDVAAAYAKALRDAGWVNVDVRCQILTPPKKAGDAPGNKWISARDLADVDVVEQSRLRGWKDGSRFAPEML